MFHLTQQQLPSHITLRPDTPDFLDLPWHLSLSDWHNHTDRLEELPHGLSRHTVIFIYYDGVMYAFKELPAHLAEREYQLLSKINELRVPVVAVIGHARTKTEIGQRSVLITRYLDHSIPFRILFNSKRMHSYQEYLLDAIAGLLVQLHIAGIYWGDCSLSNTLFRRDAGALRAYLVDAETAEFYANGLHPALRHQELEIMEENIYGELAGLEAEAHINGYIHLSDIGPYIRLRYQLLWEEITQDVVINPGENYRIQERIRALNNLGFSVGDVELNSTSEGEQLRLRVEVTDRNFHRDQLLNLTGIEAEENQAQKLVNEINELRATMSQNNNRNTPPSVAAFHWLNHLYLPTLEVLKPIIESDLNEVELYCKLLEHKWYLSERARHDVGHQAAALDLASIYNKNT